MHFSNRMTRTEGSNGICAELHCVLSWTSRVSSVGEVGQVAQLVEQRTENPRVGGSIPSLATSQINKPGPRISWPLFVIYIQSAT